MINFEKHLLDLGREEYYAIVTYNGIQEATYFKKIYDDKNGNWIMPSPCQLIYGFKVNENDLRNDLRNYVKEVYIEEEYLDVGIDSFINENIIPFIKDGIYYDLEAFQCLPYMDKEVDDIKIVTKKELFDWLYNTEKKLGII